MEDIQENLLPSSLPMPNKQPLSIDEELWQMAEQRVQEILCIVQPSVISEVNRKEVIDYVQRLIRGYYGAEVFPFGSVPLKTYLPDGDIDFTVLSHENAEEDLAQAVCSILASEENSEYQVKDIQHIRAQVQVVKCTMKNIAVDISFNQMAGLYALGFLEQVDQLVGKNHLFKRSIILIKAWCYYESRILAAHHGLLSTYAVEILVLYIINRFHSSVCGPLEVLYRFLDYYGTFDWETNYVSIYGPKALSSLPEIVETPECDRAEFLLSKEFLRSYRDICSVQARASETMIHEFPIKHMNILDPLRSDNNLGRSVSRGNLHRIRLALSYGARNLKGILTLPGESMGAALEKFFMSTLDRNGKGQRPDVEVPVPAFGSGRSEESDLRGDCDNYYGCQQHVQLYHNYVMPLTPHTSCPSSPQADMHTLSTQQNWSMFYQMGTNIYVPGQTLYHPNAPQATYCLEENVISRGTGTYIPDMTHNSYWDMHARVTRPRRCAPVNHNVLPKSPMPKLPMRKQAVEVHSETDINDKSRSFELSNADFPVLPSIHKTNSSEDMNGNPRSKKEFPLLPTICQTSPSEAQEVVQLTEQAGNSSSSQLNFELSNEEFPLLPCIRRTSPSKSQGSVELTEQARNLSSSQLNNELSNEEFPILPSIRKTRVSEGQESIKLSGRARNSSSSQLNIEFGTYSKSQSLTELSLPTKDDKEDSSVSSSGSTMVVVPRVAMQRKEEFTESDEKRWIDSI